MIVAHIGDIHIHQGDKYNDLEAQVGILKWIAEDAYARGVKVFLVAGDVFHNQHGPTEVERQAAQEAIGYLAGLAPVVIVRGNHDKPLALTVTLGMIPNVTVCEQPEVVTRNGLHVAALPWPNKAQLAATLGIESQQDTTQVAIKAMGRIIAGFGIKLKDAWLNREPTIILGHLEVGGATMDAGQPVVAAAEIPVSTGDLMDARPDYVALGHIHKPQSLGTTDCPIHYPGAIRQMTFGEVGRRGYLLVNFGERVEVDFRPVPSRALITIESPPWGETGAGFIWEGLPIANNAFRIKYQVQEHDREDAMHHAQETKKALEDAGAHSVKIDDQVIPRRRVRSEKIQHAHTARDRLEAYHEETGQPPRLEAVFDKLDELEKSLV